MASEEVMVAQNQGIGQKITQVAILLQTQKEATITAINMAIPAAVNLVEIIKHRVKGLYQVNSFEKVGDSNKTRLKIKLSFNPLNTAEKGYQGPLPDDQIQEKSLEDLKKMPTRTGDDRPPARRARRGGRGGRGGPRAPREGNEREDRQDDDRPRGNRRTRRPRGARNEGNFRENEEEGRRGRFNRARRGDRGDRGDREGRGGRDRGTRRGDRGDRGRRPYRSDLNKETTVDPPKSIDASDPWGSS